MYRVGWACVLSAAVILSTVHCNSSDPEPEPAPEPANLRTVAREITAPNCPSSCLGIHLSDYNLFLREDFTYTGNIQGKLAAGGNITLSGFSVGTGLADANVANTLVAGGNLTLTNGAVAGAAWYRGSYTAQGVGLSRGTVTQGTPPGFVDFADRFAELESLSTRLATQPSNGTTQSNPWSVTMRGTDPCLNVFTLNASDFNGRGDWTITAPADSFVLVNVFGQAPSYSGGNIQLVGIPSRRVLFNFVEATTLTAESFRFQGTMLAPKARATIRYTGFDGGLYAKALNLQYAPANLSPLDELPTATEEVCNAVDDNCDGQVDEGFECTGSGSSSCTAWCGAEGTRTCDPDTCGYGECTSASCCRADADCAKGSYCEGSRCTAQLENGAACGTSNQCTSGQCVDGVCCDSACGGDCDACNLEGHKGTCSPAPSTVQCRGSAGACDVAEFCTGSAATCPEDAKKPATAECRGAVDVCDVTEFCTGASNDCPADGYASNDTQCRASVGECDVAESCTGTGASCPADGFQSAGVACASDGNVCTTDVCNGAGSCGHPALPADTSCGTSYGEWGSCGGFSDYCDTTGTQSRTVTASTCGAGTCSASSSTLETQECTRAEPDKTCAQPIYGEWGPCSYSSTCAQAGTQTRTVKRSVFSCATGQCVESTLTETQACTRSTEGVLCRAGGVCDLPEHCSGGTCPADAKRPAGATCDDNNPGTIGDTCNGAGVCIGCGDGVRNGSEVCDDGNIVSEPSCPYGQTSCTTCNATCTAVLHPPVSFCGDGTRNGPEVCDDGNNVTEDSCPYGQATCTLCNATCTQVLYLTGEVPRSGCSSKTLTWSQSQPAWNGNPSTQGTYTCSRTVSSADDGDWVNVTPSSTARKGSAWFACVDGTWVRQSGTCDGEVIPTGDSRASGSPSTCSSGNPAESMWISWYVADLKRCADTAGLNWWMSEYTRKTTCNFRDGFYWHYFNGIPSNWLFPDTCWRDVFRKTATTTGEWPRVAPYLNNVSPAIEQARCGSLAYPWTNIVASGDSCKFRP